MTTVGQVEIDPYCRRVLAKHWPHVPRHDDVRTAGDWWNSEPRPRVDVVCGGFPCQPISNSGLQLGVADERWGWPWFLGVLRVVRPRFVIVENVAALAVRGLNIVLGDLAALGFDAEWSTVSACSVGAPHMRRRLFVVAHTERRRTTMTNPATKIDFTYLDEMKRGDLPRLAKDIADTLDEWLLRMHGTVSGGHHVGAFLTFLYANGMYVEEVGAGS